ncbi:unnamed protein product, partial [Tenebrio molitor]
HFQLVVFVALAAVANAGLVPAAAPVAYGAAPAHLAYAAAPVAKVADYDPNPQYAYGYDVQDGITGDSKSQREHRVGDVVQGSYSVIDPDGTKRTVEYTADPVHGFNAVVHKEPLAVKAVAKVAAPVAYAAPAGYGAPIGYGAPVAKVAAPVGYYH